MDDFTDHSQFRIGDLLVVPASLVVVRNGQEIKFEPRWMQVLVMLAEHANETLSTERLLIDVWGSTIYGDSPVSKTISHIRKSIGDDSRKPRYIETVSKVGYKLIEPVSLPEDYRRMPSELWTSGSPYVGLSAFDADHASVFCGRSRIVADLLRAMRSQIENQRRFVLMVGASGCGKTSLLRAGAIPLLIKPDGFDGLRALSVTTCDLGANGSDPLIPLATALAQWTLGDRPVFPPQTTDQLKALLTDMPEMIAGFISEALRRHFNSDLDEQPYAHLLLTVDHAEALVSTTDIDANERDAFARVLQSLCACPHVLVTMITRGDFYLKLIETLPTLAECKAGDGHLDVIAPRYGEVGEIIRSPAWKADLSFETDPKTRTRLDDALRDAALSQPDALPLLQHTLQTLYERRNDQRQLTFAAYDDIGGLEGAVAHRAEQVFATLPLNAQASLDTVLTKLIVIQPDSDAVSGRRTSIDAFDADGRTLVDAFTSARLFVRDHHNGQPTVGVVHEALLRRWPRAVEWTQDNRRLLQAKARLQRAAARWVEEGRQDDHLLNPGRPLGEALEAAEYFTESLSTEERSLLNASRAAYRRKKILRNGAIGTLAALVIATSTLSVSAIRAKHMAEQNKREALSLIGYMLVDLAEELRPTASFGSLDNISLRALQFLKKQPIDEMSTDDFVNYSRALRIRGEVESSEGRSKKAISLFRQADMMARRAISISSNSPNAVSEGGQTAYWIGYLSIEEKIGDESLRQWKRYDGMADQLVRMAPQNPDWLMEKSFASGNLAVIDLKSFGCDAALDRFRTSLDGMRQATLSKPWKDSWRYETVVLGSWISRCYAENGDLSMADKSYTSQIEELKTLTKKKPEAIDWQHQLANLQNFHAAILTNIGELDAAETSIVESTERLQVLVSLQPTNLRWQRDLVNALIRSTEIAFLRSDPDLAMIRLKRAKTIIEKEGNQRYDPVWERLEWTVLFRSAYFNPAGPDMRKMDIALHGLFDLRKKHLDDRQIETALADALIRRGKHLMSNGNHRHARSDWQIATSISQAVAENSREPGQIAPYVIASLLLGERDTVADRIEFLSKSGYRHPDFVAALKHGFVSH